MNDESTPTPNATRRQVLVSVAAAFGRGRSIRGNYWEPLEKFLA
jgi:hypothetical protein